MTPSGRARLPGMPICCDVVMTMSSGTSFMPPSITMKAMMSPLMLHPAQKAAFDVGTVSTMTVPLFDDEHPQHAEFVVRHAETRREERLARRRHHVAAGGQRVEHTVEFGLVFGVERQPDAFEVRLAA